MSQSHGDPAVVSLTGELDAHTTMLAAQAVTACLAQVPRPQVLVVDLTHLRFLSVAGVRMLHDAVDHAAARNILIRIAASESPVVARALAVTGMDAVFDIYPDRVLAVNTGERAEFLRLAQEWRDD
ncbi:STAS domain-containing protein [Amycolatopsis sp., V23-08]|uniref:Anti-sigma factor antagonist n=1 Tax=Amycolatopsis heterodermiae TaxID=3110235 RepID=A0ABU5R459_9PSEU|nr:STAS domain-containing protein [Amycolatopsis sp., V23-08]MEA5361007.1 STAS domain-containing protein [Amycolatopsis sp., V23-08]